jgi:hypothetical protein
MKAQPSPSLPPAPGQAFLDDLVARGTCRWSWAAVRDWLDRCVTRLGEAEIGSSGCYELIQCEEFDSAQLQHEDRP